MKLLPGLIPLAASQQSFPSSEYFQWSNLRLCKAFGSNCQKSESLKTLLSGVSVASFVVVA